MSPATANGAAQPRGPLPEVLEFMQLLWAVAHGLELRSKRMAREAGVTGPQRLVLRVVGLFPGLSAGELAAILHVHPSTLTGILRRLTAQRLLVRVDDPRDRRRAVLRLSAGGARVNRLARGTVEAAISEALEAVNPQDRLATTRVLARVAQQLETQSEDRLARQAPRSGRRRRGGQAHA